MSAEAGSRQPDAAYDVLVVGAGPAGMAAAAACAERSLSVGLLDPDPERPWTQTFAAWEDELPPAHRADVRNRWTDVRVVTDLGTRQLGRVYVLFDNARLREHLAGRVTTAGGELLRGRARGCRLVGPAVRVAVDDGRWVAARAVVDASGHRPALLRVPLGRPPPAQTAYGIVGRFSAPPGPQGSAVFMDYTQGAPDDPTPTFLYAMDLSDGRWLAEETSLAARPAVGFGELERRLHDRLDRRGVAVVDREHVERVRFPMGGPVPDRSQLVVGFGAAAGMVHPATGFSVARSLTRAPGLAAGLAEAIAAGRDAAGVARAGWDAVWPRAALREQRLHGLGLDALLAMDGRAVQQFFAAFFDDGPRTWERYVSGTGRTRDVLAEMGRVFVRAPWPVRSHLVRAAARAVTSGRAPR